MKFSVEELRAKTAKFQRRIGRRNVREYVAALLVIVFFGVACWKTPEIVPRLAYASIVVAMMFYAWYLRRWGSATPAPADMGSAASIRFYRNELARQRDLLRSFWKWALLPALPGLAALAAYRVVDAPAAERWHRTGLILGEAIIFLAVLWMNTRGARRLDGRIAELDHDLNAV